MAAIRAQQLISAGARVTVVAPRVCAKLASLTKSAPVTIVHRRFLGSDVERGYFIVISATDDPDAQAIVAEEAEKAGLLYSVVSESGRGNFITPAVVERDDLKIAISSGGKSPVLCARIRRALDGALPEALGEWAALLGQLRMKLKDLFPRDIKKQRDLMNQFIESVTHNA
jgi:siroheme synthase-like protein